MRADGQVYYLSIYISYDNFYEQTFSKNHLLHHISKALKNAVSWKYGNWNNASIWAFGNFSIHLMKLILCFDSLSKSISELIVCIQKYF